MIQYITLGLLVALKREKKSCAWEMKECQSLTRLPSTSFHFYLPIYSKHKIIPQASARLYLILLQDGAQAL